ncbi:MAG: (2Fe-2S)-binding protein, partial [Hyphomicrobiales bacterium]
LQCGFCTAGILISLEAFLREQPEPSEQELREVVGGHLCRCTGYTPIIAAAREAAVLLRRESQTIAQPIAAEPLDV